MCRVIWCSENGHGEVANGNLLMLPCTLSIVGALVLLKRHAGKKMWALLLGLPIKYIYYDVVKTGLSEW